MSSVHLFNETKKKLSSVKLNMQISIWIIFIITFSSTSTFSQENNTLLNNKNDIKGYVVEANTGEPLVFANILVKGASLGAATNKRGYFVIFDAPAVQCTLVVSYIGYKSVEQIIFNDQKDAEFKIELEQSNIQTDEVTVVAEHYKFWKAAESVGQITISPASISKLPNLGEKDIFRSLQLLPGISAFNDGSAGLYIRGGTPDQNLVLLDGITVYHVDHFFGFFSAFNSDAVKDIQVFKGGYEAKYGGRLSSVVDLTGKIGDMNKFRISVGANLLSVNGFAEIPISGKGSLLISARRSYADILNSGMYNSIYDFLSGGSKEQSTAQQGGGFNRMNQIETSFTPAFYFYDINAKLSYNISRNDFISFSFYNGQDYLDESQQPAQVTMRGALGGSANRTISDETDWGNLGGSFKWTRQWSDKWFSDLTFSYSNYFSKNTVNNQFDFNVQNNSAVFASRSSKSLQDNNVKDITFKFDNDYYLTQNNKLGFGVWYSNINTDYQYVVNDTINVLDRNQSGYHISGYLQDKWQLTSELNLTFGLRSTYFNPTQKIYIEPRAAFQYQPTDLIKIKGAWGGYNQFINQITNEDVLEGSRDFWMISSSDLLPGSAEHFILGTEFETNDYLFSIEGYYKKLDNLLEFSQRIVRSSQSRIMNLNNYVTNFFQGNGTAKGIEFLAQKKFGSLSGWISYTLGKVEYIFPEFDNGDPFPAKHDKTNEVKFVASYETGRWNFSAAWIYSTGLSYTAPESQYFIELLDGSIQSYIHVSEKNIYRLPDYHRLDLSCSYLFDNKSFDGEIGVSVFNLYNRKNIWYKKYDLTVSPVEITNVSMLGITPTVFIKLNF